MQEQEIATQIRYREWFPTWHGRQCLPDQQDWYVAPVVYSRVAGVVNEANWAYMLARFDELGARYEDFTTARFAHCGFEIALINPECSALVAAANEIAAKLEDYQTLLK